MKEIDGEEDGWEKRKRERREREREREEDNLRCGHCGQWCEIMLHTVNAFIRWDNLCTTEATYGCSDIRY